MNRAELAQTINTMRNLSSASASKRLSTVYLVGRQMAILYDVATKNKDTKTFIQVRSIGWMIERRFERNQINN